jgi:hypothetical protein
MSGTNKPKQYRNNSMLTICTDVCCGDDKDVTSEIVSVPLSNAARGVFELITDKRDVHR